MDTLFVQVQRPGGEVEYSTLSRTKLMDGLDDYKIPYRITSIGPKREKIEIFGEEEFYVIEAFIDDSSTVH